MRNSSFVIPAHSSFNGGHSLQLDDGEFLVDTSAIVGPATGSRTDPAGAFDGTNFLTVWSDYRVNLDVYGTLVSPDGIVRDSAGFSITTPACRGWHPVVAYDGTNYLVVFLGTGDTICGIRVSPAGRVLDSAGIVIATTARSLRPSVAFGGTDFLVVWSYYGTGYQYDICGARVSPAGVVLDTGGIAISQGRGDQEDPGVAFDGANFLVVWDFVQPDAYDVFGARVSPAGEVLDTARIPISTAAGSQASPAVASDGENCLVVWQDARIGGNQQTDIYAARVTQSGQVLDTAGIPVSTAPNQQALPAVAFDGTNFLAVWTDFRNGHLGDLFAARVNPAGVVLDSTGLALPAHGGVAGYPIPALASGGRDFLALWADCSSMDDPIRAARVSPDGSVLDSAGLAISFSVNTQSTPAAACDSTDFLVLWTDQRKGPDWDIYGMRLSPDGTPLDSADIAVSTAPDSQSTPALAWDGTECFATWSDHRNRGSDIYGARIGPDGKVLDTAGIPIATGANDQMCSAIASGDSCFLVVWFDGGISGTRVSRAGTVLDTAGIPIAAPDFYADIPSVAWCGSNFLAVWADYRNGNDYDVYGVRVAPNGTQLDTQDISISTATGHQVSAAVASDGTNYLVVWADNRAGGTTGYDIYAARVTPSGAVLDSTGFVVFTGPRNQAYPAVEFDGTDFLVVWEDGSGLSTCDIGGARVTPQGVVLDTFHAVGQLNAQRQPALARGPGGNMLLAYTGWAGTVQGKQYDIDRIWGKLGPFVGAGETPTRLTADGSRLTASVIRNVLVLPAASSLKPQASSCLLDISGRKVLALKPGANDVSRLGAGVYFVAEYVLGSRQRAGMRKVVITR